ncbi:hypothetical protein L345_13742, partial [Ophiophagus hannah]
MDSPEEELETPVEASDISRDGTSLPTVSECATERTRPVTGYGFLGTLSPRLHRKEGKLLNGWQTYKEHSNDLEDVGVFLPALKDHFEDTTWVQRAESEILAVRQWGRPVAEYIREFWQLASKVSGWPETFLVHQFKAGLDKSISQACVYRGLAPHLVAWFQAATEPATELQNDRNKTE